MNPDWQSYDPAGSRGGIHSLRHVTSIAIPNRAIKTMPITIEIPAKSNPAVMPAESPEEGLAVV